MEKTKVLPFEGIKIIELASVLAGPSVAMFFAELGAEVLKIEFPPEGDVTRNWKLRTESAEAKAPAYFCSVNWGKKFQMLDLRNSENRKIIYNLLPDTDIIIVSYKPGDASKLGMDYDTLKGYNSTLIYGEISGYGSDDSRVGYDAIIQAESGFTFMNGEASGSPVKMPVALIDVLAAHQLKEGILTALYLREKKGIGDYIQVSLIQSAISALVNQASNYLMSGMIPQRIGSAHPNIAPYGTVYQTQDEQSLVLAVGTDRQFIDLMKVLGKAEVSAEARFSTNQQRVQNRDELEDILKENISLWNRADLLQKLRQYKIPAGAVNNMSDVFQMPQAQEMILSGNSKSSVRTVAFKSGNFKVKDELISPE